MRLTRNIRKKQDYCEFELKKCRYQDIYDFEKYSELEENVDCDLTLAIDKLGQLEDILEKYAITDIEQLDRRLEEDVKNFTHLRYGELTIKQILLAYEWACNRIEGNPYEELLEQAKKTIQGWEEINKKGYGELE